MGEISDSAIGRIKAGAGRVRVGRIVRDQKVVIETQQTQVAPVAGVKFLAVRQHYGVCRGTVRNRREVADIRYPLLLVDDQVEYDIEVLSIGLFDQPLGCVAVSTTIVHVHMDVSALPVLLHSGGRDKG